MNQYELVDRKERLWLSPIIGRGISSVIVLGVSGETYQTAIAFHPIATATKVAVGEIVFNLKPGIC